MGMYVSTSSAGYISRPPTYSAAMILDSSWKAIWYSAPLGIKYALFSHVVSRKLSFLPQFQSRCDLAQLLQHGLFSSHFKCRSLHVKHPVRVLLGLPSGVASLSLFFEVLLPGESFRGGGVTTTVLSILLSYQVHPTGSQRRLRGQLNVYGTRSAPDCARRHVSV